MGEQISLMGLEDVKRKVGKIRIQDVLQAQLERIPEVRNHQISRRMYSVPDFSQLFFVTSSFPA